jgi:hypothetical protein
MEEAETGAKDAGIFGEGGSMTRQGAFVSSLVAVGLMATMPAAPRADTIDKLTFLTFSGNVQVPGVELSAGTYRFRLTNPNTDRNVIQVLSRDGSTVYAMLHTMPTSRTRVTNESTVTFRETPAGVPPEIKALFYGGEHSGYEFMYPKHEATIVEESRSQPPITFAPIAAATVTEESTRTETTEPAPVESALPAEPQAAPAQQAPAQQAELPHTASPVPLVALSGLASLIVGFGAGLLRKFVA